MVKKLINITSTSSEVFLQDQNLSLLIGPDRFAYLIYSKNIRQIQKLVLFEFDKNIEYLIQLQDFLKEDGIEMTDYFLANLSIQYYDALKNSDADLGLLKAENWENYQFHLAPILQYFKNSFPQFIIKDSFKSMQIAFKKNCKEKSALFSFWQKDKLFLWALHNERFELRISERYKTTEDALYYILKCYKTSDLDTFCHKLFVAGELSEDSSIFILLNSYVANIQFVTNPTDFKTPELPDKYTSHLFYDLLAAEL